MTNSHLNTKLPLYPSSLWRPIENELSFPPLEESLKVDTVIVGAGITGITAAYLLQKAGIHTALIDARKALGGTTGHTTAKITYQHGQIYNSLIQGIGEEKAKEYYKANRDALSFIQDTIHELKISCQLQTQDAYLYAASSIGDKKVREEYEAYLKLGIPAEFTDNTPLPFPVQSAIRVKHQAQFHPVKYLSELLKEFVSSGGYVFEHTRAVELEKSENPVILTAEGHTLTCRNVIISSHYPFPDLTGLQLTKLEPERSYILAAKTSLPFPEGMYISADDPIRSLRLAEEDGEQLVLLGGEDHKTGQIQNTEQCYEALAEFCREQMDMTEIRYRWSSQDIKTIDGVPFAGPITRQHPNIFITTGYGLWGMTNGTAAARIVSDTIIGKKNPYAELYSPQRQGSKNAAVQFIKQNTDTAKEFVKGKLKRSQEKLEDLGLDEGAKITVKGHKAGAYKDQAGNLTLVKPVCTHMGCDLEWNNGDRSWDCPCHGSRFNKDGEILEGPAVRPLSKLD